MDFDNIMSRLKENRAIWKHYNGWPPKDLNDMNNEEFARVIYGLILVLTGALDVSEDI